MISVDVYIEGERLDLFKDETISLVDSIQNTRDPAVVFTGFTKQFSVPASKKNNKIFQHYYNPDVYGGFDARLYVFAELRINSSVFKKGNIKLDEVKLANGKASTYLITFFDYLVNLNQVIGNTKLKDLSYLSNFNHPYNQTNVKDGFEAGLTISSGFTFRRTTLDANIVYPFISHTKQYAYDSSASPSVFDFGVFADTGIKTGLQYTQLSPAIRFKDILTAIEQQFDINFGSNGFLYSIDFLGMYLWLHSDKGGVVNADTPETYLPMESFTYSSGDQVVVSNKYIYQPNFFGDETISQDANITLSFTITVTGTGFYDVLVKNGYTNNILLQQNNNSGNLVFTTIIPKATGDAVVYPQLTITSSATITNFSVSLTATRNLIPGSSLEQGIYTASSNTVSEISILANMPDISVLDFLKGMFRMFNLTIQHNPLNAEITESFAFGNPNYDGFSMYTSNDFASTTGFRMSTNNYDTNNASSWFNNIQQGSEILVEKSSFSDYGRYVVTSITYFNYAYDIFVTVIEGSGTASTGYPINFTILSSGDYIINTLDDFYSNGSNIDVTKYIDTSDSSVLPTAPYNKISYKFEEAKTFLMDRRYAQLGERYGDDSYDLTGIFNGKNYDIKVPFEKILFERMEDLNSGAATNISNNLWAWCVDSSENPVATKPIVFFCDPDTIITGADVDWDTSPLTTSASYLLCSNTITNVDDIALGFKNEIGEYSLVTQDTSLFGKYWEDYIIGVYNSESKLLKLKAKFPSSFILNYKLNDTIKYKGREYFINELDINLNTGEAEIELITKWF